jgi:hypothetical protein
MYESKTDARDEPFCRLRRRLCDTETKFYRAKPAGLNVNLK